MFMLFIHNRNEILCLFGLYLGFVYVHPWVCVYACAGVVTDTQHMEAKNNLPESLFSFYYVSVSRTKLSLYPLSLLMALTVRHF